jgi:hypothetical protein
MIWILTTLPSISSSPRLPAIELIILTFAFQNENLHFNYPTQNMKIGLAFRHMGKTSYRIQHHMHLT